MKNLMLSAAFVAAALMPASASAQALPGAIIAVVDLERVTTECTACKTAQNALKGQVSALQARQTQLGTPLQTERQSIQTAVGALNGAQPDAALQARIQAFETKAAAAAREIQTKEAELQRNQAYIQQQIGTKLGPIYQQVMTRRGANIMLESGSTLATSTSVDVSADVITALNAALPSIATTAPAAAPQSR